jgi:acyl-coenzyme A thioesterase PaaI-like protein
MSRDDLSHIRIRLPLTWRTKNIVGSLYGGSLFAMTDGVHPMMLMAALGMV